jgi:hypothetical protein
MSEPAIRPRGTPIADAIFTVATVLGGGLIGFLAARDTLHRIYDAIASSPGPYAILLSLLFALTLAVALVWPLRGRERVGVLLALPPFFLLLTWMIGAHRLEAETRRATADLELRAQVERWSVAASDGAAVWTAGAFFAAILFTSAALTFALRGRARASVRHTTGRRVAAWVVGFTAMLSTGIGIAIVRFVPLASSERAPALAAVLPSALGVLCICLAAGALREGPRQEVTRDVLLSFLATTGAIVATGMMASLGEIAQAGPLPLRLVIPVLEERRGASSTLFFLSLAFVVPPLLTMIIALCQPRRAAFAGIGRLGLLPIVASLLLLLGPRARGFRAFVDASRLPRAITQVPLRGGSLDACAELVSSHVVKVSPAGLTGAVSVALPPEASCDDAALAIDALAKGDDAYLAVDPATPFARVGCIVDALARLRAPRMTVASPLGRGDVFRGCAVSFVGQRNGELVCQRVALGDPRCVPFYPASEPEPKLDIELTSPALLRWTIAGHTRKAKLTPLSELGATVLAEWKESGDHRDPADRRFDVALLRGNPTDSFAQTMDHFATVESVKRKLSRYDGRGPMRTFDGGEDEPDEAPAFDVRLASMGARFAVVTEATLPPWPAFPATHDRNQLGLARDSHDAALAECAWADCSFGLEARHRAALGELRALEATEAGRLAGIRLLQRALALDPSVEPTKTNDAEMAATLANAWKTARALPQPTIVFDAIDLSRVSDLSEEAILPALVEVQPGLAQCTARLYPAGDSDLQTDVTLWLRDGRVAWANADLPRESCLTSVFERVAIPGSHVTGDVTVRVVGKFRK